MSHAAFDDRLTRLTDKHRQLSLGVTYRIGPDGLIVAVPRQRVLPRFPVMALLFVLAAAFLFKAILFVGLGEPTYEARRATLAEGGAVGQAAAWALQPDPAVRALADVAAEVLPPL